MRTFSRANQKRPPYVDLSGEVWRAIPNLPFYEASNYGRVRFLGRTILNRGDVHVLKRKILTTRLTTTGYPSCAIYSDGKRKPHRIHRLVASAFIPNPSNLKIINHKDGNKCNNSPDNLEWCTSGQNNSHAYATGLKRPALGENANCVKLKTFEIPTIRFLSRFGTRTNVIARMFGVDFHTIKSILIGHTWSQVP